jgi:PIN domain nuclease of toxin-antitoxin system
MRYYIDTNILIFVLLNQRDELSRCVVDILEDPSGLFYTSAIAARELILLHKKGELRQTGYRRSENIFSAIDELNCEIVPFTRRHVETYAELEPAADHKDPNDHMIIAQAISDRIPLISSDRKFSLYESQGLQFVFNKR